LTIDGLKPRQSRDNIFNLIMSFLFFCANVNHRYPFNTNNFLRSASCHALDPEPWGADPEPWGADPEPCGVNPEPCGADPELGGACSPAPKLSIPFIGRLQGFNRLVPKADRGAYMSSIHSFMQINVGKNKQ
jgi:hypothetical protein